MSITWNAFFVDEARLKTVYGCRDESLIQQVEATRDFRFLVAIGAESLARNLEYAKKVAPRPYEPLQDVSLDPAAALRDIVLGRELRPRGVEFYDRLLWPICEVIGTKLEVEDAGLIVWLDRVYEELAEPPIQPEQYTVHPYLPVPAVPGKPATNFSVFSPTACTQLFELLERRREKLEDLIGSVDDWLDPLEGRDPSDHMILFGA